nr:uncharacterized protein LOC100448157 [Pongo abelii]
MTQPSPFLAKRLTLAPEAPGPPLGGEAVPQTSPRPRRSGNRSPSLFKVLPKQAPRSEAARPGPAERSVSPCSSLLLKLPRLSCCRTPARGPGRRPGVKYGGRGAPGWRRVLSDSAGWRAGHLAVAVREARWPKELPPRSKAPAHLRKSLVLGEERSSSESPLLTRSHTYAVHAGQAARHSALAERRSPSWTFKIAFDVLGRLLFNPRSLDKLFQPITNQEIFESIFDVEGPILSCPAFMDCTNVHLRRPREEKDNLNEI